MLCEECGKNEATVHIRAIGPDGASTSKSICQSCLEKMKAEGKFSGAMDITGLLGALFGRFAAQAGMEGGEKLSEKYNAKCDCCGTSYMDLRKTGLLGCPQCYRVFNEYVEENLISRNGTARYTAGEEIRPAEESPLLRARRLKEKMKEAVQNEDFETAAKLRDELKQLKAQEPAGNEAQSV